MTLEELEKANSLAGAIRRLTKRVEWWSDPRMTLYHLVREKEDVIDDVDVIDEADVAVLKAATVEKLKARLSELAARFAALPLTMEFTVTYADSGDCRTELPRQGAGSDRT